MRLDRLSLPLAALTAVGCGHNQSKKDQALIDAIEADSLTKVQAAIQAGANTNALVRGGATSPLLIAIASHAPGDETRKAIIETLLEAGADPSKRQNDGMDALYMAANGGDADLCASFCKAGVSPTRPAFRGLSAWHAAAIDGSAASLSAMLPYIPKAQIDAVAADKEHGDSALGFACSMGHKEAAELLLDHGANPDFVSSRGFTPLLSVATSGDQPLAEAILAHGAHVDFCFRNGATPLALASVKGHLEVMRVFIAHGADVNHQNKIGVTPLMDAVMNGHPDAVDLLLKAGARADIHDNKGLTAADYKKQRKANPTGPAPESAGG